MAYIRVALDDRVRVQIIQLTWFKLIRAAKLEQGSIAGFGRFLSAIATDATVLIILIAEISRNLSGEQLSKRIYLAHG